jgi:diaminohydroxyphosphoribosylaminopyrimidine deaminase/5-amino-6-(5-phosphoribosylamino)uracil reductase
VDAGVIRVVYAVDDINPVAAGGADRLIAAGVDVVAGLDHDQVAAGALRPWLHALQTGRPFVTWKLATTLDGRVAAADRTTRWISSEVSRADAHAFRAVVDAILVGSGTVLADDPSLTVRDGTDRRHRVPQSARVLDNAASTLVLDTAVPRFALKALHDQGVRHVLLEGGPTLAGAFIEARCVDEVIAYVAPKLLGAGPSALGDSGIATLAEAVTLEIDSVTRVGPDVKIVARPVWAEEG